MLVNLLISVFSATLILAAAYLVVKPVLRKQLFDKSGTVREVVLDSESKALLMTVPFTWYCNENDFVAYATKKKRKDQRIELVGHFMKSGNYVVACQWVENALKETKYDLSKMTSKYCQVAFKTCAVLGGPDPVSEAERLLLRGVRV